MTGLVYKECKQNRWFLLAMVVLPFLVFFLPVLFFNEHFDFAPAFTFLSTENGKTIQVMFLLVGYVIAGDLQARTYMGDDSKKWGYFIASSPEGIKGYMYSKYALILSMCGMFAFLTGFADSLYGAVACQVTHQEYGSMTSLIMVMFYVQLFVRAIDMPFIIRFGMKQGSIIKMIMFVCVILVFAIVFVIAPDMVIALGESVGRVMNESNGNGMLVITGVFPYAAIALYVLSYKISCKLYMKGVEHYDK